MAEKDHYKFGISKQPRRSLAQLFRDIHKIESQVALLRLDLQAAGVLPKTAIRVVDEAPEAMHARIVNETADAIAAQSETKGEQGEENNQD